MELHRFPITAVSSSFQQSLKPTIRYGLLTQSYFSVLPVLVSVLSPGGDEAM